MGNPAVDSEIPDLVRQKVFAELAEYPTRTEPYWIQIMGIPAAGKSELVRLLAEALAFRKPHALAATDEYLAQIPAFKTMMDREQAFRQYDPVATAFGLEVHHRLIKQKSDVVFERSLASTNYRDLMYDIKRAGYIMIMIKVDVDFNIALQRARAREVVTGRHVPESVIAERVSIVQDRWVEMKKLANVMIELQNNGDRTIDDVFAGVVKQITDFVRAL
jgi:predicted ABC-type ATPase